MKRILQIVVFAAMSGCVASRGGYVDVEDDVYGSKKSFEYPQKSRAVAEMVSRLMSDPDFADVYKAVKERASKRGHARPTIVVREIEDNREPGRSDSSATGQMRKELKTALRKTKMFAIVDIYERERMKATAIAEADSGADQDNIQNIGAYEAGDFFMFGELAAENAGGKVFYHIFNLRLVDPISGNEIWSDTVKIGKR